jgi:amino acid transporter
MSEATRDTVRSNARVVGVLLQCLAVVTLVATFIVAITVAQQGKQLLGVTATHDPVPWIVLAAGVIASLIFAGLGYTLAMLCAIYDRQAIGEPSRGALGSGTTKPHAVEWRVALAREVEAPDAPKTIIASSIENTNAAPIVTSVSAQMTAQGGLWKALTKERHFRDR